MARRNLDLWAVAALAGAGLAAQWLSVPAGARVASGLALMLLCPGYAITAALFPGQRPGWPERVALCLGLSLAVAALGAIILNGLVWGLQTGAWAALFGLVTLGACLVAAWRRGGQTEQAPTRLPRHWPGWQQWALLGVAALLTAGALTLTRTPSATTGVLGYTLLWITPAVSANPDSVRLGLSSSEFTLTHYHLTITLDGRLFFDVPDVALEPGEKREQLITLPGWKPAGVVEAVLYRLDQPHTVYRRVTLLPGSAGN